MTKAAGYQRVKLMTKAADYQRVKLPGFGLAVNQEPRNWYDGSHHEGTVKMKRVPNAISDWAAEPMTVREKNMLAMINQITDKAQWSRKAFDDEIVAKWRTEALTEEGQGWSPNQDPTLCTVLSGLIHLIQASQRECLIT
jgi:hypothetical protein